MHARTETTTFTETTPVYRGPAWYRGRPADLYRYATTAGAMARVGPRTAVSSPALRKAA